MKLEFKFCVASKELPSQRLCICSEETLPPGSSPATPPSARRDMLCRDMRTRSITSTGVPGTCSWQGGLEMLSRRPGRPTEMCRTVSPKGPPERPLEAPRPVLELESIKSMHSVPRWPHSPWVVGLQASLAGVQGNARS